MPDVNELLNFAIQETENLNQDEVFLIRDLFKGYEWNRISRSQRLLLGTLFLNYVNTSKDSIQAIEKTSSGQQKYRIKVNNGQLYVAT
ncbi:single-stranded DNA-binding protein [Pelotomaculum terephthalicicum JT]|uniref:single-stranded DNA-binding protein n=1 Tax=Pelotomaculum terephthalicicum TaxID=206393 RepID=UPI001F049ED5|nr:single-stranded DNA-binding protein [Pelotomaculum terephthalicicum]MCG9968421.1 single-stranded DNA-binding protein [Pelotomaculum terephthalicicum JT]